MSEAGFDFSISKPDVEETFPDEMPREDVATYLASKKAEFFKPLSGDEIIVTADTVVILGDRIMNKPETRAEAIGMLQSLSGNTHTVITGVCILSWKKAGENGFLCVAIPEESGGIGADRRYSIILMEEQYRLNLTGLGFALHSDIVAPYIDHYGTAEQKQR